MLTYYYNSYRDTYVEDWTGGGGTMDAHEWKREWMLLLWLPCVTFWHICALLNSSWPGVVFLTISSSYLSSTMWYVLNSCLFVCRHGTHQLVGDGVTLGLAPVVSSAADTQHQCMMWAWHSP